MLNILSFTCASLAVIASTSLAAASGYAYPSASNQFYSYYTDRDSISYAGPEAWTAGYGPFDYSCARGVYPWIVHSCGTR
jgi:hypothetical protein